MSNRDDETIKSEKHSKNKRKREDFTRHLTLLVFIFPKTVYLDTGR